MLDTIIKLLERFVTAHELLAANSTPKTGHGSVGAMTVDVTTVGLDTVKKVIDEAIEDEEKDEPAPKKTRKPRQAKQEQEPEEGPDLSKLKEEIKTIAKHIAAGDDDDCANDFDDLLEDFKVRTVTKLADDDIEAFHKAAKKLVAKYYEIDED